MTVKRRREAYDAWEGKCGLCRGVIGKGEPFEVDHQIPLFIGGKDELTNLQILHPACHTIKTKLDAAKCAKLRRLIEGPKPSPRPIQSRGFDKTKTRGFDGRVRRRA